MAFTYKTAPMPRMGFRVDPAHIFFDRQAVVDAVGRARAKAMSLSALAIKRSAKRSMKYVTAMSIQEGQMLSGKRKRFRKVTVSKPFEPPRAIRPHPWVRKFTWSAFDKTTQSAVVGPMGFTARGTGAPRILEHGGVTARKKNKRRTRRVMGGAGEIRIGGTPAKTTKQGVTYGKLHTQAQVTRANKLNEELYGPSFTGGTFQAPRPFMGPALLKEVPNMPKRWAGAVHGK